MPERPLHLEIPATESAPAMARDAVAALDGSLGDAREDTLLLVSELVTNSVVHAGVDAVVTVTVTVIVQDDVVRVEVGDPGRGFESAGLGRLEGWPTGDEGGWGLRLVEMLARRWGVEPQGAGALVWFEMERRPDASGALSRLR